MNIKMEVYIHATSILYFLNLIKIYIRNNKQLIPAMS